VSDDAHLRRQHPDRRTAAYSFDERLVVTNAAYLGDADAVAAAAAAVAAQAGSA